MTAFVDQPPILQVFEPNTAGLARPELRIHLRCIDDGPGPCTLSAYAAQWSGNQWAPWREVGRWTAEGELDVGMCLANRDGEVFQVWASATDNVYTTFHEAEVTVELGKALSAVEVVPGELLDADLARTLYRDAEGDLYVRAVGSDAGTRLGSITRSFEWCGSGYYSPYDFGGRLAPGGALYVSECKVIEAVEGAEIDLGGLFGPASSGLMVRGRYALWTERDFHDAIYRDLSTGASRRIRYAKPLDLRADGVALVSSLGALSLVYPDGGGAQVSTGGESGKLDGESVIASTSTGLVVRGPGGDQLVDGGLAPFSVSNGWIAFARESGLNGARNVCLRAPDGGESQLTDSDAGCAVEAVSPSGEVIYLREGQRYWVASGQPSLAIGTSRGRVFWDDGWYVIAGNTLFAVSLDGGGDPFSQCTLDAGQTIGPPGDAGSGGAGGGSGIDSSPKQGCGCTATGGVSALWVALAWAMRRRRS